MAVSTTVHPGAVVAGAGGGGGAADPDYVEINVTTQVGAADKVYASTSASGCSIKLPAGIAEGKAISGYIKIGSGGGPLSMIADSGATVVPSGTLQVVREGMMICAVRTPVADQWMVIGYDTVEPRFLGYCGDYPAVISDFPVNGGTITALGVADFLWCTPYGQRFVPNVAKNRMVAESRRINLIELGGIIATPIDTRTAAGMYSIGAPQLPAYLAQPGDFFEIEILVRHTAGSAATGSEVQLKLGTANTSSDQTIAKSSTNSANNQDGFGLQRVYVHNQTTVGATQLTSPNSSSAATQNTPTPLDFNALQYFNLYLATIAGGSPPDSLLITQLRVTLVQKK